MKYLEGTTKIRIRMLKKSVSDGMSGGCKRHQPCIVIKPGTEQDLIGGVGWHILHLSDISEPLQVTLQGMETGVLPKVDAVTEVGDKNGKLVLLGIGGVAHDR